jgi:splicing factor 45
MSKRPGGLYGGIQFSSGVTYQPTVTQPEPEEVKKPAAVAPVQQPTPATSTVVSTTGPASSTAKGATTSTSKSTAGISILNLCKMQPVY